MTVPRARAVARMRRSHVMIAVEHRQISSWRGRGAADRRGTSVRAGADARSALRLPHGRRSPAGGRRRHRALLRAGRRPIGPRQDRRHRADHRRAPHHRGHRQRAGEHPEPRTRFARPTSGWPIRGRCRPTTRGGWPRTHKAVLAIGGSIHASEIGATQAANELLYTLATATDAGDARRPAERRRHPDPVAQSRRPSPGRRLVPNDRRARRSKAAPMPWLYHKYAGHDINRDAFMMNMAENRNLARFFYTEWHPQVFLTMHQMDEQRPALLRAAQHRSDRSATTTRSSGARRRCSAARWRSSCSATADRGVVSNAMYDYYWPGYEDSAPLGHNTVCLLTEVASVSVATPITMSSRAICAPVRRACPSTAPQINFPDPVAGRPLDASRHRRLRPERGARAAARGRRVPRADRAELLRHGPARRRGRARSGGPFAFVIPPEQHDPHAAAKLDELLLQGGDRDPARARAVPRRRRAVSGRHRHHPPGAAVPRLREDAARASGLSGAAPARARAPLERPYDVAGWTLPLQMGVDVSTIERTFEPPRDVAADQRRDRAGDGPGRARSRLLS